MEGNNNPSLGVMPAHITWNVEYQKGEKLPKYLMS
jgi:hypothetical protein